ncbi:MAG: hypothetical protein J4432_01920 [DPANN group archaeon]|nr:hypothetical protein [DPANN group archaeon]
MWGEIPVRGAIFDAARRAAMAQYNDYLLLADGNVLHEKGGVSGTVYTRGHAASARNFLWEKSQGVVDKLAPSEGALDYKQREMLDSAREMLLQLAKNDLMEVI